jgi:FdhE protein
VADVRRDHPEAEAWLELLEAALAEGEDGGGRTWEAAVPAPPADRPAKAPLLFRAQFTVDRRTASRWVRRMAGRRVEAPELLEAALCQDDARLEALAAAAGADPQALRVASQMAVVPLLQACGRLLAKEVAPAWWEGYCPLCGAWPVLSENIGLERKRQLRCGRCGIAWALPPLRCVFCGEIGHDQLGYLAPDEPEPVRRIEFCRTCNGYLKALTTIRGLAPWDVLLDDLTSVHLDVVALERGHQRPERPGHALEARVA